MTHFPPNCQSSLEIGGTVISPMKLKNTLLMAVLGLTMSALTLHTAHAQVVQTQAAKSASIKISALPFNITAPGTYVLTGNLNYSGDGY
jgi:hypothetical protein